MLKDILNKKADRVAYHADFAKARVMLDACPELKTKLTLPKEGETLLLSHVFFRNLTPEEFEIVYNLPIQIGVSKKTFTYIDIRRKTVKLMRPQQAAVLQKQQRLADQVKKFEADKQDYETEKNE